MRRTLFACFALALLGGCGEPHQFADEVEELHYLSSHSKPTPAQWKRRKALAADTDFVKEVRRRYSFGGLKRRPPERAENEGR